VNQTPCGRWCCSPPRREHRWAQRKAWRPAPKSKQRTEREGADELLLQQRETAAFQDCSRLNWLGAERNTATRGQDLQWLGAACIWRCRWPRLGRPMLLGLHTSVQCKNKNNRLRTERRTHEQRKRATQKSSKFDPNLPETLLNFTQM
jgi:hypothetical protein